MNEQLPFHIGPFGAWNSLAPSMIAVCMYENNLNGFSYIDKSGWNMFQLKNGGIFA